MSRRGDLDGLRRRADAGDHEAGEEWEYATGLRSRPTRSATPQIVEWIALAISGGMLGNAAYDGAKARTFLIDGGTSRHPTTSDMPTLRLRSLEAEHPEPTQAEARLAALDVALTVRVGDRPRLLADLRGVDGAITLG